MNSRVTVSCLIAILIPVLVHCASQANNHSSLDACIDDEGRSPIHKFVHCADDLEQESNKFASIVKKARAALNDAEQSLKEFGERLEHHSQEVDELSHYVQHLEHRTSGNLLSNQVSDGANQLKCLNPNDALHAGNHCEQIDLDKALKEIDIQLQNLQNTKGTVHF